MNTCKTCKWWIEHRESKAERLHHICTNPNIGNGDDETNGLSDNADHDYGISTGPDFGCIHHEAQ
jgi:hypothetical protein